MFAYCNNNPVCYADKLGTDPDYVLDINNDGEEDCFVYSYSFDGFFDGGTCVGHVYFYQGVNSSFFEDENNWPESFNKSTDLMVADFTGRDNPTLFAYQAQNVKAKHRSDIIDLFFEYVSDFGIDWGRTKESVLTEWKEHNRYALFSKTAQDIDFDKAEEGMGTLDYLKKAIDRAIH